MIITTNFRHLGEQTFDTDTLPEATIAYLIAYGLKQSVDDAGADPEKAKAGSEERLKNLLAGVVPSGRGGGPRLSELERAIRDIVEGYLKGAGWKSADAAKEAKKPQEAFKQVLRRKLAAGKGLKPEAVSDETVEEAFEKNWPKVEAQAARMVELARPPSMDL